MPNIVDKIMQSTQEPPA